MRAKLQAILDAGESSFSVSRLAAGDDPAYGVVKTVEIEYVVGGEAFTMSGRDPETLHFPAASGSEPVAEVRYDKKKNLVVEALSSGRYELKTASGRVLRADVPAVPEILEIDGPWELRFPPAWGAPERVTLDTLGSWSENPDPGVKYFSGTARYSKTIDVSSERLGKDRRIYLDLGDVQVMAMVMLNGKDLGILWKPPYRIDVTEVLKAGKNTLEIGVTNLWINRMIGDEELPEDSERNPDGTLKAWPEWVQAGTPSPTGRFTFTSWRLWKKGDALVPSGLIGPVTLRVAVLAKAK